MRGNPEREYFAEKLSFAALELSAAQMTAMNKVPVSFMWDPWWLRTKLGLRYEITELKGYRYYFPIHIVRTQKALRQK